MSLEDLLITMFWALEEGDQNAYLKLRAKVMERLKTFENEWDDDEKEPIFH